MIRRVTGDGYGYGVARMPAGGCVVCLRVGHVQRTVAGSFDEVIDLGQRFAHALAQWGVVQRRARALAQGYAVLGW